MFIGRSVSAQPPQRGILSVYDNLAIAWKLPGRKPSVSGYKKNFKNGKIRRIPRKNRRNQPRRPKKFGLTGRAVCG
jgi:hypothetical protein